jgi:EAL domain-containing protein (putative c-di-GMP-specific phosphodiesterase class I)
MSIHIDSPFADPSASPLAAAVSLRDRAVAETVRQALRQRSVALAFQPVMQARDPGAVAFHEGLIRILDPSGRVIPAAEFIPVVEGHEAGRILDCLALELGLQTLFEQPGLRLSVNMSARSIGYPRWVETLERGLAGAPTVGERLILEITESSAMQMPEVVSAFMARVRRHGIAFALDDFGAGFTAFRYFRDFFFDIVKIDGQFVRNVAADSDNQVLTEALVLIARHFDMFTVAESVESVEDVAWLTAAGVDCLQGYYFGAPAIVPPWKEAVALSA